MSMQEITYLCKSLSFPLNLTFFIITIIFLINSGYFLKIILLSFLGLQFYKYNFPKLRKLTELFIPYKCDKTIEAALNIFQQYNIEYHLKYQFQI